MRYLLRTAATAAALLVVAAGDVRAQTPRQASSALVPSLPDSAVLSGLQPRNIGPAVMSGRISDIDVAGDASNPRARLGRVIYVTSAGGGVWKTVNGGKTWAAVFDGVTTGSMGAVAVTPSNPDVVWVGSGESNNLRSSSWGDGIYKSTDAGSTWTHMGLPQSQHIARILVHPTDPNTVYVAAMGPLWSSGGERGVYKTTDGGATWTNVKALGPFTGFTDLAFDPSNPETIYAASYQRERKAYSFVAGGPESGIWKSTDAGRTWRQLSNGLPAGDKGRIGISVARSQPRTIYATIHADSSGIFRSDDGGETWRKQSNISSIPWFFGQIRVDPNDAERVYFLGVQLQVSDDGGRTWRGIAQNTHADHHAMWIDPNDSNHLLIGNDGGFFISYDRGESWDFALNLPVSTFYAIGVDMREPFYWVYGGLQDNGTWGAPNESRMRTGITNSDWVRAGGGDGFYAAIDPTDPHIVYVESQNGNLRRFDLQTQESKSIRPPAEEGERHRYNWSAPLLISPHDNNTLYFGAHVLFRSSNRGDSWETLSGDLTRALDRDTLPIMGLRAAGGLGRHDGTAEFGNLATIDESTIRPGLLWTGSDDGLVHLSRDGGRTWSKFDRFAGVPDLTYVSRVVASRHNENTAYVTFDGHRNNDFKPYVLKTTDLGRTWTSIASNLPQNSSVQVIREHHRNPDLLFVGTETGVWVTVNGGQAWARLAGLPVVAVHDLIIHPRANDLVIGTHGRGIWILDDLAPLERLAQVPERVAHVFAPDVATIYNPGAGPSIPGDREYSGNNPARGALLSYLVRAQPTAGARPSIAIVDASGAVVRELSAQTRPGLHRLTWDLRYPSPNAPPGLQADSALPQQPGFGQGAQAGPYVAPGQYRVQYRIATNGGAPQVAHEAALTVQPDPLVRLTSAQHAELQEWRMKAYRAAVDVAGSVRTLEAGRTQLAQAAEQNRQLITEIDEVLVRLRGRQTGGRGGGGGGFGAQGGAAAIQQRLQGALGEIGTLHFPVTDAQKRTIDGAIADFERERSRIDGLRNRLPATR